MLVRLTKGLLQTIDSKIRLWIKGIVNLPINIPRALFHVKIKVGGLRFITCESTIPRILLKRLKSMETSPEPAIIKLLKEASK